jgi:dipeptidyl aminopeptidase/acylaminoacyl peptidase
MQLLRLSRISFLIIFALAGIAQTTKRPLHHRDYDPWRAIQGQGLSRDGKFLAYSLFPEDGDGEIVVRNLTTGKESRESAGSLPPAPDTQNFEAPPEAAGPAGRSVRLAFTADGKFLISTAFPKKADTDQAKKDKKRPDEMPKPSLVIFDLSAMTSTRIADVASFQVPESGESLLAYLKGPKASGTPAAVTENEADQDQQRGGRGGRGGGGARAKTGSDLIVHDLRVQTANERTFEDVTDYSMSKDGKTLAYTVASKKEESNGTYAVVPGTDAAPVALLSGKGRYSKLSWDFAQKQLAFLSDRDDAAAKPPKYKIYLWDRKGAATELVSESTPGFRSGYAIFERGTFNFSRDGSRLFLSAAPVGTVAAAESDTPVSTATPGPNEEKVVADLWRWNDDYIQPMQKVRAAQERARSYRAVIHLADKKFVQLADPTMIGLTPSDDGRYAMGMDDRALRHMVDYDGTYNDVYLVDTVTGARKLILPQMRGGGGGGRGGGGAPAPFSPDGKYLMAFKDKHWWSVRTTDGALTNLTAKTGAVFFNEEHDTPDTPPAYGSAGWTKDGKWVLVYDEYDVWAVAPDGGASKKLTDGRASHLQFRVMRLDTAGDDEEERGIDPAKPLFLRAENTETRDSGFYSLANLDKATPQKLLMGPKNYRALGKAKDADVVMITATTFKDQPDIQITDTTFRSMKKVTDANPQQAGILWGSGELIKYHNDDGVELQAALYKPENFNPQRKYPMMIYIYERLSQNVNTFVRPAPGTSINIAYYVSNGYLVLTPDIVYTTGHPGQSALKCVLPAIEAVVAKGFVNRNSIGIQGHSWGGYQTAYLLTQTNLFHAAEAGAPVVDMISAYNGIRWGTGLPRQFQYEKTQSRIGGTLWEEPLRFIENSPVFQMDRIKTPVLILQNDGDDAVPWYQGIEFFLSMRRLGKEAYLFNYNGEPHGLRRRPDQKDYTVRMQEFFDYLLKDAPKPAWMEKGIPYIEREQEKEKHNSVYDEKK